MRAVILILSSMNLGCSERRFAGLSQALPDNGRALIVGDSPTNGAAVRGPAGEIIGPQGKGEGVLVVEDAGRYEVHAL